MKYNTNNFEIVWNPTLKLITRRTIVNSTRARIEPFNFLLFLEEYNDGSIPKVHARTSQRAILRSKCVPTINYVIEAKRDNNRLFHPISIRGASSLMTDFVQILCLIAPLNRMRC